MIQISNNPTPIPQRIRREMRLFALIIIEFPTFTMQEQIYASVNNILYNKVKKVIYYLQAIDVEYNLYELLTRKYTD